MGIITSSLGAMRTRLLANPIDVLNPSAAAWKHLMPELGAIGEGTRPIVIQGGLSSRPEYYEPLRQLLLAGRSVDEAAAASGAVIA